MQKKELPKITDIPNLKGMHVLLRASFNVPVTNGSVTNQFRIMRALPTINYLVKNGARVIIAAHIGRDIHETLEPVYSVLKTHHIVVWSPEVVGPSVQKLKSDMKDGDVLLLENLRSDVREKKSDPDFVKSLADLADLYINDAFAASHREHSSITGVPHYLPSYFGFNFIHEYEELMQAIEPKSPSILLLGGAKFETKMPLVEKYLDHYDHIFVGGALANDFFRAKNYEIGTSLKSDINLTHSDLLANKKILLPIDLTVQSGTKIRTATPDDVRAEEKILDSGPDTISMLAPYVEKAKSILWNGPLGEYEHGFEKGTIDLAKLLADSSAYSVVGGGDTIAAIESLCLQEKFGFLSTAGGAMLTLLEYGTLPAITAVVGE